jgi:hypothetical protein
MYLICIIARWKLNLIHCYWIPFTFEFVTTLIKYVLIKLRRYLFDCMHINGGFFHQWKLIINRWSIDESHAKEAIDYSSISNINRLINIDWYWLISILIDYRFHRLSTPGWYILSKLTKVQTILCNNVKKVDCRDRRSRFITFLNIHLMKLWCVGFVFI